MFQRATKQQARLRLALIGPAGSGKTFTALAIATTLGDRVALLDTERGSASKYSDLFTFDTCALENHHPCGYYQDSEKQCTCSPSVVARYQKRISGPLLDRIDIHVEVPRVQYEKLTTTRLGEPSCVVRARVTAARERQARRFRGTRLLTNADMGPAEVREHCRLDEAGQRLMQAAMRQLQLSARAYHRVLKLARTIADLAGADGIAPAHLAEAIQYRTRRME